MYTTTHDQTAGENGAEPLEIDQIQQLIAEAIDLTRQIGDFERRREDLYQNRIQLNSQNLAQTIRRLDDQDKEESRLWLQTNQATNRRREIAGELGHLLPRAAIGHWIRHGDHEIRLTASYGQVTQYEIVIRRRTEAPEGLPPDAPEGKTVDYLDEAIRQYNDGDGDPLAAAAAALIYLCQQKSRY